MFPACLCFYRDKLGRTQLRGKAPRPFFFFSPTHYVALFPSKIQLTKNKWACQHRSENSFGLESVFVGLYGSALKRNLSIRENKAAAHTCGRSSRRRKEAKWGRGEI